jgi:cell division protein FtsW
MRERTAVHLDYGILAAALFLLGLGIVLVYSSSFAVAQQKFGGANFFLNRQMVRALVGIACFIVFAKIDYHLWARYANVIFIAAIGLLLAVLLLPETNVINGARRWVSLGPLQFQVSDLARIALVVMLARQCEQAGERIREAGVFARELGKSLVICGLIVLEPNFSTALILAVLAVTLLFIAGARFSHIASLALLSLPAIFLLVTREHYRMKRVLGYLNLAAHKDGIGYQAYQSLIGLGNGGLFGVGLGQGEQKLFYLPEPHTDFVFSIIGEEIGFVGLVLVLALFSVIIFRGMRVAMRAGDRTGLVMAFGFSFVLAEYVILHTCVNAGLVPTTGVPLPFLSYGGMSLIFTMISMGILLNISSQMGRDTLIAARQPVQRTTARANFWSKRRGPGNPKGRTVRSS